MVDLTDNRTTQVCSPTERRLGPEDSNVRAEVEASQAQRPWRTLPRFVEWSTRPTIQGAYCHAGLYWEHYALTTYLTSHHVRGILKWDERWSDEKKRSGTWATSPGQASTSPTLMTDLSHGDTAVRLAPGAYRPYPR